MQLFGLVNTLLHNDRECSRRDLQIVRYAVIPLSPNSGLIEWVPDCDTLHILVREYRENRKILLNIENRLMLAMAPDFENLPVIAKVEVFQHALTSTTGQDLNKAWNAVLNRSSCRLSSPSSFSVSLILFLLASSFASFPSHHPPPLPSLPAPVTRRAGALAQEQQCGRLAAEEDQLHALTCPYVHGWLHPGAGRPPPLQPHAPQVHGKDRPHRLRRLLRGETCAGFLAFSLFTLFRSGRDAEGEVPGESSVQADPHASECDGGDNVRLCTTAVAKIPSSPSPPLVSSILTLSPFLISLVALLLSLCLVPSCSPPSSPLPPSLPSRSNSAGLRHRRNVSIHLRERDESAAGKQR
eukprot:766993-Hanusia_phi.AAC.2